MEGDVIFYQRRGVLVSFTCPCCKSNNITKTKRDLSRKTVKTDNNGNSVNKITNHEVYDCICNECKHDYVVDAGRDEYVLYAPPVSRTNDNTVKLLVESKSNLRPEIYLYSASRGEDITYFIMFESDFPMIVTKEEVEKFLEKPEELWIYAYKIWRKRYQ